MKKFIIQSIVVALSTLACAYVLPGVSVDGFGSAILVAFALTLLNQFVKPLLVLFTIPVTVFTFGLFLLVINAVIIMLADWMVLGFYVDDFWWALLFSVVLTLIRSVLNSFLPSNKAETRYED